MSVDLSPELENRISEAVRAGRYGSREELVEEAVQRLLEETRESGRFHQLRREIERSGMPLLSNEELEREIRERRGRWA